jgi:hypothetical protein
MNTWREKVKLNVSLLHFFLEDEKEKERKWRIVYTAWRKGTHSDRVEYWSTGKWSMRRWR